MLNISPNSIQNRVHLDDFFCATKVGLTSANTMFRRWLFITFGIIFILFLVPWTQNIQSKGKVTTLRPEQRPQTIHSTIAGRIEEWHVQEGQLVNKGDTIAFLSEIKPEYLDPQIVERTFEQVRAKEGAVSSYKNKADVMEAQISALQSELTLKRKQLQNKVQQSQLKITSDSIELERAKIDLDIAGQQFDRVQQMYKKGIAPLVDVEKRKLNVQKTKAKRVEVENKMLSSRNDLLNAQIALNGINLEYRQKIAKVSSDRYSTLSDIYSTEGDIEKMNIQAANYEKRNQYYYIIAPQTAYITKALITGIGETIKEGQAIVSIMPADYELAVEMYVRPMNLPLVNLGQKINFIFDGWPAFIFSGWPNLSFGTFSGTVVAIDNITSENGNYRVLVAPDDNSKKPWPHALRPGSGAQAIALLNDVPVWYEVWRQLNGFPPDYYDGPLDELPKLKAPVKSIPK